MDAPAVPAVSRASVPVVPPSRVLILTASANWGMPPYTGSNRVRVAGPRGTKQTEMSKTKCLFVGLAGLLSGLMHSSLRLTLGKQLRQVAVVLALNYAMLIGRILVSLGRIFRILRCGGRASVTGDVKSIASNLLISQSNVGAARTILPKVGRLQLLPPMHSDVLSRPAGANCQMEQMNWW
jgi:hypothetical protein